MLCLKDSMDNAASVYDNYKKQNPLMMRKKMSMEDIVFRKDDPDRELFHLSLSWDAEWYVILTVLILLFFFMGYKICKLFK